MAKQYREDFDECVKSFRDPDFQRKSGFQGRRGHNTWHQVQERGHRKHWAHSETGHCWYCRCNFTMKFQDGVYYLVWINPADNTILDIILIKDNELGANENDMRSLQRTD